MDTQEDTVTLAHHPTLTLDPRGLNQGLKVATVQYPIDFIMLMRYALFCRTMGCQLGDNCRFSHNVPGGYKSAAKMTNLEPQIAQSSKKTQTSGSVGSSSAREDPREGSSFGSDAAHPARRNPYKSELCEKFAAGKFK
ncbi:hypothetical protein Bca52824_021647 [Brassica carinata]|uniref:C3H1-type domain-containing protein n=1 Tax=Brassica carinata TaxID=52824 RepID=A0A8X8AQI1_BRACI|nr:hypothetical protein Bca52824_021647 [Brassica carinata]